MTLEEKIRKLPAKKRKIIEELVDIMLKDIETSEKLSPKWAGKAEKLGHDGVYWQHKALEWREDEVSR